jgi:hypothetical protein
VPSYRITFTPGDGDPVTVEIEADDSREAVDNALNRRDSVPDRLFNGYLTVTVAEIEQPAGEQGGDAGRCEATREGRRCFQPAGHFGPHQFML